MIKFLKIFTFSLAIFLNLIPISIIAEENKKLIKIKFATDWRAQAEQGGFYHALALGLYEEMG